MEAEMRDLDPGLLAGLEDRRAGRDLQFLSVDRHLGHRAASTSKFVVPAKSGSKKLSLRAKLSNLAPIVL
jgi:hypothetical protein